MLLRVVMAFDEGASARRLRRLLRGAEVVVETVRPGRHAWERTARRTADIVLAGESIIPEPLLDSLALLHQTPETPTIVVLCRSTQASRQAELLAAGCDVVLHEGLGDERLADALKAVLVRRSQSADELTGVERAVAEPQLADFVSRSAAMQSFLQVVRRVVDSGTSLLILGETGVGKERLARAIHAEGPRSAGPFVAVNCGALPEALLESEMFGHEEGAYTGATRSRKGCFEIAHRGTIFLDEIAEMPLHLQVKLLRVLQDHEIRRVGGEKPFSVDVRVMAASNRDLDAEVDAGRFRKDLFYRLSVVSLTVPPLRERREDIPALVDSYIEYLRPRIGRSVRGIAPEALEALQRYRWPGNVRELINLVERAMLLCDGDQITLGSLPAAVRALVSGQRTPPVSLPVPRTAADIPADWLDKPLEQVRGTVVAAVEQAYLTALLETTGGRVGETADRAGIQPRSLYEKMKRYGLRKETFRRRRQRP